jgi:hypothetical protein
LPYSPEFFFLYGRESAKSTLVQSNSSNTSVDFFAISKYHILVVAIYLYQQECRVNRSCRSKAISSFSFTHSTPRRSINSSADGIIPALKMADTALQAASFVVKDASIKASTVGPG